MFDIKVYEAMAMLDLSDDERTPLKEKAESLTESFSALDAIDAAYVEPLVTVLDARNIFRDDIAEKYITREELLKNAPARHEGFFRVPGTLE